MSIYSTTALPSLDLLGGVETLQRILKPHTAIAKIAWDQKNLRTIAVLETHGSHNAFETVADAMKTFEAPIFECKSLTDAVTHARLLAKNENVVDFTGLDTKDPYSL